MSTLTLHRLAINALWPHLTRQRWRGGSTRDLNDYGDRPPFRAIARGRTATTPTMNATIRQTDPRTAQAIAARIPPEPRANLTQAHHVVLERHTYEAHLATAPALTRHDLAHALHPHTRTPRPFAWDANGRGEHHLLRVYDPYLTPLVYAWLHDLANLALIWSETTDPPHLIEDHEIPCQPDNEPAPART